MMEKGCSFGNHLADSTAEKIQAARDSTKQEYVDHDILGGFGPSRIPPGIAPKLAPSRVAIEREITDFLHAKPNEPPAMIDVALNDSRYLAVSRQHPAIVITRKGIGSYKGRLCARWDTVPLQTTAFALSPTAHRCDVKLICSISSQLEWAIRAVDISQAFLQSSNLNPEDRVIVIPPPTAHLPRTGKLPPMNHDVGKITHSRCFLSTRPLRGGRGAAARWFVALPKRIREHGFTRMQTDVYMCPKRDSHGELTVALVAHVGDLLFCGAPTFREESTHATRTLRTGDLETIAQDSPIIFTGLAIELESPYSILLSRQMYDGELPIMNIAEYLQNKRVADPAGLRSTFKQGLGSPIWLHQTRPDIGFAITQNATQILEACESADKAIHLANLYNKIVKFAKNRHLEICCGRFPTSGQHTPVKPSELLNWKLLVFTDAGFGTLVQNHIVESHVVILGDVIERGGITKCHGLMLDHRRAKIHRARRSTMAAESHAAVTAVEVALRFRVLLAGIFTHHFDYKRLTHPTEFPLMNPPRESPPNNAVRKEADMEKIHALFVSTRSANPLLSDAHYTSNSTCNCCKVPTKISTLSPNDLSHTDKLIYSTTMSRNPAILFHPMVLGDCCSLYLAILRLQPKTVERGARITLAFLRDSMQLVAFIYIDATVNLGGVGAKHAGIRGILGRFLKTGRFALSFVGGESNADKR